MYIKADLDSTDRGFPVAFPYNILEYSSPMFHTTSCQMPGSRTYRPQLSAQGF